MWLFTSTNARRFFQDEKPTPRQAWTGHIDLGGVPAKYLVKMAKTQPAQNPCAWAE